jgi:hypothetical protein
MAKEVMRELVVAAVVTATNFFYRYLVSSYPTTTNPYASDFESKKKRIEEIGRELYTDGGTDAMENMFYSIEFRIKEEIGKDAKPYRSWWNNISPEWKY